MTGRELYEAWLAAIRGAPGGNGDRNSVLCHPDWMTLRPCERDAWDTLADQLTLCDCR